MKYDTIAIELRSREKFGDGGLLVRSVQHREKFKLIVTVRIETRHFVKFQFGCDFPAICNHCGVITA